MSRKKFISLLFVLIMPCGSYAAEFYVGPDGDDGQPGTKEQPFKTIAHARDRVAKINSKMTGDITVYLRGGTHELSGPVVFDTDDSGSNGHAVIYKAFPGETPVISGGKLIKGWSIHDKELNIYKASVGDLEFRQIYVDGKRATRARYPNKTSEVTLAGYLRGARVTRSKPHQLKVDQKELDGWEKWRNLNEIEVVMLTHWKQKRARIAGISGDTISFQEPENTSRAMHHHEQPGTPHWYENAYEFLDVPGEFYLNTTQGVLYYKPREGKDMSSAEVNVPTVETLFDIKGGSPADMVHDLVFEGLTFEYSQWTEPNRRGFTTMQSATAFGNTAAYFDINAPVPGAIQLQNAERVAVRACAVRRTGAHGIVAIRDVVSDCSIVGNYINDTAAGGIYLLLTDEKSTGNKIADNTIERVGVYYSNGCGILVTRTPDVSILHNEIRDVRYTGISTGWSWNDKDTAARNHEVAFNLIHHVMRLHDDGGGIYTLGKVQGMQIHHNYIHSVTRSKYAGSYGICGIYLDNGSCFKHVHDNVIENVEAAFFAGNKPNYNNVFANNFHNGRLAKKIEKSNTVRENIAVNGSDWPKEAREIMAKAGPRDDFRRPKYIATPGKIGGAMAFNGRSDFVEAPHSPELDPVELTIQAWIRMEEWPRGKETRRWIVNKNGNEFTDGHYALIVNGDRAGAYLNIGGGPSNVFAVGSAAGALELGRWCHLAMTYDGAAMRLFVDGQEVASQTVDRKRAGGGRGFAIGRRQDAFAPTYFNGLIDELRLYDRPLSGAELKQQYQSPREVEEGESIPGLVGYWPF